MPLRRPEAPLVAAVENQRFLELVRGLTPDDWAKPTDCPGWDVRAMVAHVLGGMEAWTSVREFVHVMRAAKKAAGTGPFVDGLTAVQIRDRAELTTKQLLKRMERAAIKSARRRGRLPALFRKATIGGYVGSRPEVWRLGYLVDVILTRDTWMHRVDVCRATGRKMVLTAEHDGRIVADIVAEWARRHGKPCTLMLGGPAGGVYTSGTGEQISIDAVGFCRVLSGRDTGSGLLTQEVPF
jgi:uncharacterized protein (TIGR03083 family)